MKTKTYTKTHKSKKAADTHAKKIKARGGKLTSEKTAGGTKLTYSFDKSTKVMSKKIAKEKGYNMSENKSKLKFDTLQNLNLKVGEKAICTINGISVTVTCIKNFSGHGYDIIDNPKKYVKSSSQLLTSHLISSNWLKISKK